jgi:hypothetical protein
MGSNRASAVRLVPIVFLSAAFVVGASVTQGLAACGDGVLNPGEECDDGSQNNTTNSCCDASCKFNGNNPDVIVGELTGTTRYGNVGGITAYAIGTNSCNIGSCWLNWFANTPEHPVIGQNMYRLKDGRFEHIGQSWLKHGYTALAGAVCSTSCVTPPNGTHLGVNCSDPYSSSLNGTQTRLGPKDDVNPNTGVFLFPDPRENTTGDAIFKRLQVHDGDLNPTLNPGAIYFVEGQYVTRDDAAAKNNANNASYRPVTVGAGPNYNLSLTGSTQREKAGIQAWKAADPAVIETFIGAPDGLFILAAKATALGGGVYHYEYALQNLTNQRAGQSFSVPIQPGTTVTNVGFHDVDYHSGTPYVGTDWTPTVTATSVTWETQTFAQNVNANALRWGTLYNFRFDANVAPGSSSITLGLFRTPSTVTANTVTPGPCTSAPNGTACDDHNVCTQSDACSSGACVGSSPVVCAPLDVCHDAGTCNPASGCSNPAKPDGFPCDDGSACTQPDGCVAGTCTGANPVVCLPQDVCHDAGVCDALTGICPNPERPDGSPCNSGDPCLSGGTCGAGICGGEAPVVCLAQDTCHDAGTCDAQTGICSNPARPDGTSCDDANACTTDDACANGACTGIGVPVPQDLGDVLALTQDTGVTTVTWSLAVSCPSYSVLRGLVSQLPVGPGGGDEQCLEVAVSGTSTLDAEDPDPDVSFWYLVRGMNACGAGPYGFEAVGGAPSSPRQSATCP